MAKLAHGWQAHFDTHLNTHTSTHVGYTTFKGTLYWLQTLHLNHMLISTFFLTLRELLFEETAIEGSLV